jgi:hypothetical protein
MAASTPDQRRKSKSRARARSESTDLAALFKLAEEGEAGLLGSRAFRIRQLLTSDNHQVRVQTERLLMEQQFGKPHQAIEHSGSVDQVRFLVEAPPNETAGDWLARHAANRAALEEVRHGEAN